MKGLNILALVPKQEVLFNGGEAIGIALGWQVSLNTH